MNLQEYSYETMTEQEKVSAYPAICHWHDTNLTHSVYVLNCDNAIQAEAKAHEFFLTKQSPLVFRQIKCVEIKRKGVSVFDAAEPVFWRNYNSKIA